MDSLQSLFADVGKLFAPAPHFTTADYDGLEYRWKNIVFRPAQFKKETFILLAILLYVVFYYVGKARNRRRVDAWVTAHLPLLSQQFSRPQVAPIIEGTKPINGLVSDGSADFCLFSTGRRHVASLHTVFSLLPRYDLLQTLYDLAYSLVDFTSSAALKEDTVELDFTLLPSPTPGFVWGVVSKDHLRTVKDDRWDLTFTRTTESPLLSGGYCVMAEYADVTEALLKTGPYSIAGALNDPVARPYIKSLTITDQPRTRPTSPPASDARPAAARHLILTLRLPPAPHAGDTLPIVRALFTLIDALEFSHPSYTSSSSSSSSSSAASAFQRETSHRGVAASLSFGTGYTLRPETRTKLVRTREEFYAQLVRERTADEKERIEADKVAAKRRAEEERVGRMSGEEQSKHREREKKRQARKAQGKVVKK